MSSISNENLALLSKISGCPAVTGAEKMSKIVIGLDEKTLSNRTDDPDTVLAIAHSVLGSDPDAPTEDGDPVTEPEGEGEEEGEGDGSEEAHDASDLNLERLKAMSKDELQDTALKLGLDDSGLKRTLLRRIKDFLDL